MTDCLSAAFIVGGLFFYFAGTIGLFRFPDTLCRLHSVTKADNLGLGLLIFGSLIQIGNTLDILKVVLIWALVLAASAAGGQLIAAHVSDRGDDSK